MSELSVGTLSGLAANSYVIDVASGSQLTQPGMILQVVSTTKTDTFTTSSTSFVDVTGLAATITPSSTSSKIMVMVSATMTNRPGGFNDAAMQITRGGTGIFVGDAAGSRIPASMYVQSAAVSNAGSIAANHLDSPNTTSATTYAVQLRVTADTAVVNRSFTDTDSSSFYRGASSITLMEIAA